MIPRSRNLLATGLAATLAVTRPRRLVIAGRDLFSLTRARLAQLQLIVDAPSHWRRFLADDLADAFASRVADVFRRQGFTGEVRFIPADESDRGRPVLAIRLIRWRLGRADGAECTFTATIQSGGKEENLGTFEQTRLAWNSGPSRRGLAEALGEAADGALRNLAGKLAQGGSMPGFPAGMQ